MELQFEEHIRTCTADLKVKQFENAARSIYPISKQTPRLMYASDDVACKFATQVINVLEVLSELLGDENMTGCEMGNARLIIMDIYRIMRNSCAASTRVQDQYGKDSRVMCCTQIILDAVKHHMKGEYLVQSMAVGIQFLSNLATNSTYNQDLVWNHFKMHLRNWLLMANGEQDSDQEKISKILNCTCSFVEVCLPRQWERDDKFLEDPAVIDIILTLIHINTKFTLEFGKKVMAKVVQIPNMLKHVRESLDYMEWGCVLAGIQNVISDWRLANEAGSDPPTLHTNLEYLCEYLIHNRSHVTVDCLQVPTARSDTVLQQHVKILGTLSEASSCKSYHAVLTKVHMQESKPKNIVMYAIELLSEIHKKGQEYRNMLSIARDPREVDDCHPGYLLRRDLVRIIGNLSFENAKVQNEVREFNGHSGIALLLDHTIIDERNPFICEWAKLALTNLVRDNEENAMYVKSLKLQGHVDPVGILKDCGLTLEMQGERVIIKSESSLLSPSKLGEKSPCRQ